MNPQELAEVCDKKHPDSTDDAVKEWFKRVKKLRGYVDYVDGLVRKAGRKFVDDVRHERNTRAKKQAGAYGGPAKVLPGMVNVEVVVELYMDYAIAGTRLGNIQFDQLQKIESEQNGKANGFLFNARLCAKLYRLSPKDVTKTIEDSLTEKKLAVIFEALRESKSEVAV